MGSAGTHTLISQSALPNRITRPVMGSPCGLRAADFTCRMRMMPVSTYSGLVEYRPFQPVT